MHTQKQILLPSFALMLMLAAPGFSRAEDVQKSTAQNLPDMKFAQFPGLPTCATGSVQSGDPTKGASIILAKTTTGCKFPWHWHTPIEQVMMVAGVGRVEMKDSPAVALQPGGFARMPSKHIHQFTCTKSCTLYIHSDTAFDIHYVDAQEQEITPDVALKKVHETAAAPAK